MNGSGNQQLFQVQCSGFNVELNCSESIPLWVWVRQSCCKEYAVFRNNISPHVSARSWYQCCETLTNSGFGLPQSPDWGKGTYHTQIIVIGLVGILVCLFISGATRSLRRRWMPEFDQSPQDHSAANEPLSANPGSQMHNQMIIRPPAYGELENNGLTKEFTMNDTQPPPYSSCINDPKETIQCRVPEDSNSVEDRGGSSNVTTQNRRTHDKNTQQPYANTIVDQRNTSVCVFYHA